MGFGIYAKVKYGKNHKEQWSNWNYTVVRFLHCFRSSIILFKSKYAILKMNTVIAD